MSQFNRLPGKFCVVFKHFQDLKNLMLSILREKLTLASWARFYSKPYKAFRVAQCKQPWLNFDLNVLAQFHQRPYSHSTPQIPPGKSFAPGRAAFKTLSLCVSRQRCLNPPFLNHCFLFLLPPLFRIFQPSGQDQRNANGTSCSSLLVLTSMIYSLIFLWTPLSFSRSFAEFSLKLVYHTMVGGNL